VMLQILCAEVYRMAVARAGAGAPMTESDLDRAGGLDGVVRRYLDRVIAAIPEESVLLSRTVLDAMLTQEKTKRAVTFETLVSADFSASREELQRILGSFVTHRLLRAEQRGPQLWYELSHERLVQPVLDWLKLDRDFFNFRVARDLVANSCSGEVWRSTVETLLAEGALIHVIGPYAQRLRFSPLELEFVYRSAVYRKTDASHWAALIGQAACTAILLEYFRSDSAAARSGAAHAAASLPDPDAALGDACVELAMNDPEPLVQRVAGRALATLATEAHLARIALALKRRQTRPAALEVIADLRQMRRPLGRFGVVSRLRARWIENRRVRRQHAEEIREREKQGALIGLLTAIAWSGLVALPVAVVMTWLWGYPFSPLDMSVGGAIVLVAAMAVGTFFGWRIGRAAAVDAAHHGEGRWFHAIMRLRLVYGPLVVLPVGLLVSSISEVFLAAVSVLAVTLTAQLIVGLVARSARAAVWPRVAPRSAWGWSLAASAGLPFLLVGLSVSALLSIGGYREEQAMVAMFGAGLSLIAAVAVNTLSRAAVSSTTPAVPPALRRVARIRLVVLLALVFIWAGLTYGRDSLPIFASSVRVDQKQIEMRAPLRPHLSDSAYFRLVNRDPEPRWLRVTDTPPETEVFVGADPLSRASLLMIPTGRQRLVMRGQTTNDAPQVLRLEQIPAAAANIVLQNETFVIAPFGPSADPSVWTATINGTVATPDLTRVRVHVHSEIGDSPLDVVIRPAADTNSVDGGIGSETVRVADPVGVARFSKFISSQVAVLSVRPDGAWSVRLELRAPELPPELAAEGHRPFPLQGRTRIDVPVSLVPSP
jgi:hypothetical protein